MGSLGAAVEAVVVADSSPGYGAFPPNPFRMSVHGDRQRLLVTVLGLMLSFQGHINDLPRAPNIMPGGGGPGVTLGPREG